MNQRIMTQPEFDDGLAEIIASLYADPRGFVQFAYPWGKQGSALEPWSEPDIWQIDFLEALGDQIRSRAFNGVNAVAPIRFSIASGHGIGKSALTAWLIHFIMSTRPMAKGVITSGKYEQLKDKTWAELAKWKKMAINGHWFEYRGSKGNLQYYHDAHRENWSVTGQACTKENADSFAGLHNARSTPFFLFDEACFKGGTEILTSRGWVDFRDLTTVDHVLTMDPDTRKTYYERPSALHAYDHNGPMYTYRSAGASFSVTPNHRMLYRSRKLPSLRFKEIQDFKWGNVYFPRTVYWTAPDVEQFRIPSYESARKTYPEVVVRMDDWMEFLGWYVTEGTAMKTAAGDYCGLSIAQYHAAPRAEIMDVCRRLGFKHAESKDKKAVLVYEVAVAQHVMGYGPNCLNKRVPCEVRTASKRQINIFLDAAVKGDGYQKKNTQVLYTSCEELAGDYQELILKTGVNSTVTRRKLEGKASWVLDHYATSSCDGFVVTRSNVATEIFPRARNLTIEHYEGKVYCVSVPKTQTLFTRFEGKALWSGNSAVPDEIYEVAEGGLTDGEPMIFLFGNPTKSTGAFADSFGRQRHRWTTKQIDSRTARMTNKELHKEWIEDYGDDSDFVRVRIKGQFPRVGDCQFISTEVVENAIAREVRTGESDPIVMGVDVARFGADQSVILTRKGRKVIEIRTYRELDLMQMSAMVIEAITRNKPHTVFVDGAGIGAGVVDRLRQLGYKPVEVQAGARSMEPEKYINLRSQMWCAMREWLNTADLPDNRELMYDLIGIEYGYDNQMRVRLEKKEDMKKRGLPSPDLADALSLTFAEPVNPIARKRSDRKKTVNWRTL